ncbi:MAG: hypothetical protein CMC71_01600 [Flavobacteriaceae bacterium]|mgnify:FL=1|jgi:hypothetical protein|nr:hypothetical protein [Flavobacteriaceae bacterium]
MKVQLDDRWGRPSGLWSENGELILEGVDMEKTKAMIKENILKMNAGPQPQTIARRKWVEEQKNKRRR